MRGKNCHDRNESLKYELNRQVHINESQPSIALLAKKRKKEKKEKEIENGRETHVTVKYELVT